MACKTLKSLQKRTTGGVAGLSPSLKFRFVKSARAKKIVYTKLQPFFRCICSRSKMTQNMHAHVNRCCADLHNSDRAYATCLAICKFSQKADQKQQLHNGTSNISEKLRFGQRQYVRGLDIHRCLTE